MALRVSNDNNGFESCALTSTGLFLDWFDLSNSISRSSFNERANANSIHSPKQRQFFQYGAHLHDLILQLGQEKIHDLVLLDG